MEQSKLYYLISEHIEIIDINHYHKFVSILKTFMKFAKYDRDPSEDEIIYILYIEQPNNALQIIDYIIKQITFRYVTYISESLKKYGLSYSLEYPFNELKDGGHMLTSVKNVSINNCLELYFEYRSKKISGPVECIFNELFTYDILARYYYGNDYIANAIKQLSNETNNFVFMFYRRAKRTASGTYKVDIETIKKFIGFIAILSEHVPNLDKTIFFNYVSFYHRLEFKQYLINKFN
ncbi:alpha-amanitin target protein [Hypsugopox virus]|nr:alpha-amanitin target protein [Hypsugopox virus]